MTWATPCCAPWRAPSACGCASPTCWPAWGARNSWPCCPTPRPMPPWSLPSNCANCWPPRPWRMASPSPPAWAWPRCAAPRTRPPPCCAVATKRCTRPRARAATTCSCSAEAAPRPTARPPGGLSGPTAEPGGPPPLGAGRARPRRGGRAPAARPPGHGPRHAAPWRRSAVRGQGRGPQQRAAAALRRPRAAFPALVFLTAAKHLCGKKHHTNTQIEHIIRSHHQPFPQSRTATMQLKSVQYDKPHFSHAGQCGIGEAWARNPPELDRAQRLRTAERIRALLHERDAVLVAHYYRSEEHTSELQSPCNLVCRLLL